MALAVAAKLAVDPAFGSAPPSPYLLLTVAILISSLVGGFWPGILATFLAAGATDYFFLDPKHSLLDNSVGQQVQLAVFVAEGAVVSAVGAALGRTIRNGRDCWIASERSAVPRRTGVAGTGSWWKTWAWLSTRRTSPAA